MTHQPWLIVISGPNGSGKSTFYKYVLSRNPFLSDAVFLNYDNEFKQLQDMPEYAAQYQQIASDMTYQINTASTCAASAFKKQMEQIGGNLNERITQPVENKEYWHEQYLIFTHVPTGWEYLKENLQSRKDLAKKLGGKTIHDRINAKSQNDNWYVTYKKLIHNLEIQKTIITNTALQRTKQLDRLLSVIAVKNIRTQMQTALTNGQTIVYETVGTASKIKQLAQQYKYKTCGLHICVLHPEINIARVQQRVQKGGHNVQTPLIIRRYEEYLQNLTNTLITENTAVVIDNSGKKPFIPIFLIQNNLLTNIAQCPKYLQETYKQISDIFPEKSINDLINFKQNIDIKKLTDEQRENFGQIVITNLLNFTPKNPTHNLLERIKTLLRINTINLK